jgi:hypothetical protein
MTHFTRWVLLIIGVVENLIGVLSLGLYTPPLQLKFFIWKFRGPRV